VSILAEKIGPIKVIICVENDIGYANQLELLTLLKKSSKFYVRTTSPHGKNLKLESGGFYNKLYINPIVARLIPWNYVISTDKQEIWFYWNYLGITIAHGSAIASGHKKGDYDVPYEIKTSTAAKINIVCIGGPGVYKYIKNNHEHLVKKKDKLLVVTGIPKLKQLKNINSKKTPLLEDLGLDIKRQTILVSSHWTEMSILRDFGVSIVDFLLDTFPDLNIIITAHPKLWGIEDLDFNGDNLKNELLKYNSLLPNFKFVQTGNPYELMETSNFMLCDHSSIRVEYSLLSKPAGLYRNHDFICESQEIDNLYRTSSSVFSNLFELIEVVNQLKSTDYPGVQKNKALRDFFFEDSENAAKKIHDIMLSLGKVTSTKNEEWSRLKKLLEKKDGNYNLKQE
jgi:hypothetical protein